MMIALKQQHCNARVHAHYLLDRYLFDNLHDTLDWAFHFNILLYVRTHV